jgi:hypothetical protein
MVKLYFMVGACSYEMPKHFVLITYKFSIGVNLWTRYSV